jgi:hypothetical protein
MCTLSKPIGTILVLLAVCLFGQLAHAKYSGGRGVPNDPYRIATVADLIALGETPGDYGKHFVLVADIDLDPNLPGRKVFTKAVIAPDTDAIKTGYQRTSFVGVFAGNGHRISHLTIQGKDDVGLFGALASGAEVKNLGVMDINVTGSGSWVGGLVGHNGGSVAQCYSTGVVSGSGQHGSIGGLVGYNWGALTQCYSTGVVSGTDHVGGLVGENGYGVIGTVTQCYSTGTVSGKDFVGGLVGYNWGPVTQCYSTGAVSGSHNYVGGLVGENGYGYGITVTQCYSTGAVNGKGCVGGLVGRNYGSISTSSSTGSVSGDLYVGGLVGGNLGTVTQCSSTGVVSGSSNNNNYVGGLVGYNTNLGTVTQCSSTGAVGGSNNYYYVGGLMGYNLGTATQCYSTGPVSGKSSVGGLVGYNERDVLACFWDTQTSGQATSAGGTGKTTAQMQTAKTFLAAGWDFVGETKNGTDDIWLILEGEGYPRLVWELTMDKPQQTVGPTLTVESPISGRRHYGIWRIVESARPHAPALWLLTNWPTSACPHTHPQICGAKGIIELLL